MWLRAKYHFHTYCYRDPRSVYSSTVGTPVVSPTTIILGIYSTLFRLGMKEEAINFFKEKDNIQILVDTPNGIIFFRAFHQVRRYETSKYGENPRLGLTKINQATKEYGLVDGEFAVYIFISDENLVKASKIALSNLTHLGTHDSLCSLTGLVELDEEPKNVIYQPSYSFPKEHTLQLLQENKSITLVSLSKFKAGDLAESPFGQHWYLSGGDETEILTYVIQGSFRGTTNGKIYKKNI